MMASSAEVAMDIPAASWSSNNQPDTPPPCAAIQLVTALPWLSRSPPPATTGTATTIEESNVDRTVQWMAFITTLSSVIYMAVTMAILDCKEGGGGGDDDIPLPWLLLSHMLTCVYMAAAVLARGHLMLFLPRAPLVVCDALLYYGFVAIAVAVAFSNFAAVLLFHLLPSLQVAWFCIVGVLVAAVVAFWLCLVRTYTSCGESSDWLLEMAQRSSGPIGDGLAYLSL